MCVWHNKKRGQIHIPLSELPQDVAKRTPRNQSPPSSRNNTHKVKQISKMYWKTSNLELQLDLHLWLFSHLFPESEPKCPTGSAGLARSSKKLPKKSYWVSKYGPRVIKMAAECVRMQPAGPKNMLSKVTPRKMKGDRPLGPRKVAQGCPNTDRRSQK